LQPQVNSASIANTQAQTQAVQEAAAAQLLNAGTQSATGSSQDNLTNQQAQGVAGANYQAYQGGGIASTAYTTLPWILGGIFVIGLVGYISYKAGHPSRKKRK